MSEQRYLTSGQLIPPLRLFDFSTIVVTSDIRNAPFVTATRFRTNSSDMPAVTGTRKPPITRRPITDNPKQSELFHTDRPYSAGRIRLFHDLRADPAHELDQRLLISLFTYPTIKLSIPPTTNARSARMTHSLTAESSMTPQPLPLVELTFIAPCVSFYCAHGPATAGGDRKDLPLETRIQFSHRHANSSR